MYIFETNKKSWYFLAKKCTLLVKLLYQNNYYKLFLLSMKKKVLFNDEFKKTFEKNCKILK